MPPRRSSDLHRSLSLGGRIPPVVGLLLLLVLAASVGSWLARSADWAALSLAPVLRGQLWRLVSWPLVQLDPLALVFGGIALYFFAPQLAREWGDGPFLGRLAGLAAATGVLSLALAWALGFQTFAYVGIWPLVDGLVILWALRYPDQRLYFQFILPITGRTLGLLTLAVNVLYATFGMAVQGTAGFMQYAPGFLAMAVAWAMSGGRRMPLWRVRLGLREWWLEQKLRRRTRHLKVVGKDGRGGKPKQWMN